MHVKVRIPHLSFRLVLTVRVRSLRSICPSFPLRLEQPATIQLDASPRPKSPSGARSPILFLHLLLQRVSTRNLPFRPFPLLPSSRRLYSSLLPHPPPPSLAPSSRVCEVSHASIPLVLQRCAVVILVPPNPPLAPRRVLPSSAFVAQLDPPPLRPARRFPPLPLHRPPPPLAQLPCSSPLRPPLPTTLRLSPSRRPSPPLRILFPPSLQPPPHRPACPPYTPDLARHRQSVQVPA